MSQIMSKKKLMILYGFMVRYGENNRWGPGRPPPVVFRQNEMPWLLGLRKAMRNPQYPTAFDTDSGARDV